MDAYPNASVGNHLGPGLSAPSRQLLLLAALWIGGAERKMPAEAALGLPRAIDRVRAESQLVRFALLAETVVNFAFCLDVREFLRVRSFFLDQLLLALLHERDEGTLHAVDDVGGAKKANVRIKKAAVEAWEEKLLAAPG